MIDEETDTRVVNPGPSRIWLAKEIRAFLQETGMRPTPFGILAANDDKILQRLERSPKGITLDKADGIIEFMREARASRGDSMGAFLASAVANREQAPSPQRSRGRSVSNATRRGRSPTEG